MKQIDIKYLIAQRPKEQRIWMVRASGGLFTETFSAAGLMAIGHVDGLLFLSGHLHT